MPDRDIKPDNVERLIASLKVQAQTLAHLARGELDATIPVSQLATVAAKRALRRVS